MPHISGGLRHNYIWETGTAFMLYRKFCWPSILYVFIHCFCFLKQWTPCYWGFNKSVSCAPCRRHEGRCSVLSLDGSLTLLQWLPPHSGLKQDNLSFNCSVGYMFHMGLIRLPFLLEALGENVPLESPRSLAEFTSCGCWSEMIPDPCQPTSAGHLLLLDPMLILVPPSSKPNSPSHFMLPVNFIFRLCSCITPFWLHLKKIICL